MTLDRPRCVRAVPVPVCARPGFAAFLGKPSGSGPGVNGSLPSGWPGPVPWLQHHAHAPSGRSPQGRVPGPPGSSSRPGTGTWAGAGLAVLAGLRIGTCPSLPRRSAERQEARARRAAGRRRGRLSRTLRLAEAVSGYAAGQVANGLADEARRCGGRGGGRAGADRHRAARGLARWRGGAPARAGCCVGAVGTS